MEDEKNIQLVLTQEQEKEEPIVTLSGIFRQMKRFFLPWLLLAIICGALAFVGVAITAKSTASAKAVINFNFKGIEEGKDPAGNTFDVSKLSSPAIVKNALESLNLSAEDARVDDIRNSISIGSVIPQDAYEKITAYKNVAEIGNTNAMSAVQAMLGVTYFPSQYTVALNAKEAGLNAEQGVDVLDAILASYKQYFFETYGYNEALGSAVVAVDYKDYDYERATEVFDSTLSSAQKYVNTLAKQDATAFRSSKTGYTFSDLSAAIDTFRSVDLDWLNSYITMYNVTKDRSALITYYEYKVESLTRSKEATQEELAAIDQSITTYQKDTVLMFAGATGTDGDNKLSMTQASEAYDKMFAEKTGKQEIISEYSRRIKRYTTRLEALKIADVTADEARMKTVEEDMDKLYQKVVTLMEQVNTTADEYYETVAFANAYSVVVPASGTTASRFHVALKKGILPIALIEALLLAAYVCVAFIRGIQMQMKLRRAEASAAAVSAVKTDGEAVAAKEEKNKKK